MDIKKRNALIFFSSTLKHSTSILTEAMIRYFFQKYNHVTIVHHTSQETKCLAGSGSYVICNGSAQDIVLRIHEILFQQQEQHHRFSVWPDEILLIQPYHTQKLNKNDGINIELWKECKALHSLYSNGDTPTRLLTWDDLMMVCGSVQSRKTTKVVSDAVLKFKKQFDSINWTESIIKQ